MPELSDLTLIELEVSKSDAPIVYVKEIAHKLVDEVRRLMAVVSQQKEELDVLEQERNADRYRADVAIDVAADLVARVFVRLGAEVDDSESGGESDAIPDDHQHDWAGGRCNVCGESIYLGSTHDDDYAGVSTHHSHTHDSAACPIIGTTSWPCPDCL